MNKISFTKRKIIMQQVSLTKNQHEEVSRTKNEHANKFREQNQFHDQKIKV